MIIQYMHCERCGTNTKHATCMPGWQCEKCGNVISRFSDQPPEFFEDLARYLEEEDAKLEREKHNKSKPKPLTLKDELVAEKMLCNFAHIRGFGPFKHLCSKYIDCKNCQMNKSGYAYKKAMKMRNQVLRGIR